LNGISISLLFQQTKYRMFSQFLLAGEVALRCRSHMAMLAAQKQSPSSPIANDGRWRGNRLVPLRPEWTHAARYFFIADSVRPSLAKAVRKTASSCSKCLSQLVGVKCVFEPSTLRAFFRPALSATHGRCSLRSFQDRHSTEPSSALSAANRVVVPWR